MASTSHRGFPSDRNLIALLPTTSGFHLHTANYICDSTLSVLSDSSCATASTGVQSQVGARWGEDFPTNINSGFGAGTPRSENRKGVREGREKGVVGMPRINGVGRTGKGPAAVSAAMLRALGLKSVKGDDMESTRNRKQDEAEAYKPMIRTLAERQYALRENEKALRNCVRRITCDQSNKRAQDHDDDDDDDDDEDDVESIVYKIRRFQKDIGIFQRDVVKIFEEARANDIFDENFGIFTADASRLKSSAVSMSNKLKRSKDQELIEEIKRKTYEVCNGMQGERRIKVMAPPRPGGPMVEIKCDETDTTSKSDEELMAERVFYSNVPLADVLKLAPGNAEAGEKRGVSVTLGASKQLAQESSKEALYGKRREREQIKVSEDGLSMAASTSLELTMNCVQGAVREDTFRDEVDDLIGGSKFLATRLRDLMPAVNSIVYSRRKSLDWQYYEGLRAQLLDTVKQLADLREDVKGIEDQEGARELYVDDIDKCVGVMDKLSPTVAHMLLMLNRSGHQERLWESHWKRVNEETLPDTCVAPIGQLETIDEGRSDFSVEQQEMNESGHGTSKPTESDQLVMPLPSILPVPQLDQREKTNSEPKGEGRSSLQQLCEKSLDYYVLQKRLITDVALLGSCKALWSLEETSQAEKYQRELNELWQNSITLVRDLDEAATQYQEKHGGYFHQNIRRYSRDAQETREEASAMIRSLMYAENQQTRMRTRRSTAPPIEIAQTGMPPLTPVIEQPLERDVPTEQ